MKEKKKKKCISCFSHCCHIFECVLHPLPLPLSSCLGCIPPLIGLPSPRFLCGCLYSLFLLSVCFCLCFLFYRDDVLCWLLSCPFSYVYFPCLSPIPGLIWFGSAYLVTTVGFVADQLMWEKQQQQQQYPKDDPPGWPLGVIAHVRLRLRPREFRAYSRLQTAVWIASAWRSYYNKISYGVGHTFYRWAFLYFPRALSLRNLVSGHECGRVFPAGVGPGSPSRGAANWLPSRFSLSVETRGMVGWGWCSQVRASSELQPRALREVWRDARGRERTVAESLVAFYRVGTHQIRRRRRAARSLTSQGSAEPVCARIKGANREDSEGKADVWPRSVFFLRGPLGAASGKDLWNSFKDQGFGRLDAVSRAGFTSSRPPLPRTSVFQFSLFLYDVFKEKSERT